MLCTLEEILNYKHPAVVNRFKREFPDKAERAEDIFSDLLRFFWGTRKHREEKERSPGDENLDFVFIMDGEMRDIDLMWHLFLLYTRDYAAFCDRYFGEFLHHQPDLVPYFQERGFEFERNLERFLNYSFDLFGEDVIMRWFPISLTA